MNSISPSSAAALSNLINVSEKGDVPMTTSLKVAEIFGKMHKNVLQAIDNLDCSKEFKERNFQPCVYEAKSGFGYRKFRMYRLTRDGFVLLTMGFTGTKAAQFKQWYIAEFNRMEAALRDRQSKASFLVTAMLPKPCVPGLISTRGVRP
jgi:Rha family phage regulatory protein